MTGACPPHSAVDAGAVAPPLAPLPDQLGAWIDAYASAFGSQWGHAYAFSGYLLAARDGVPIFEKAYGRANRSTGARADGDTRFRIGSITKQFTAVAVLQLAEKGLVCLDDPRAFGGTTRSIL
jgi:CubicO group peptidase (beta-lactamase class C family)